MSKFQLKSGCQCAMGAVLAQSHLGILMLAIFAGSPLVISGQGNTKNEIAFISDTQAPMAIEKIFLKSNQNERATALVFHDILKERPRALFILGDVVSLGYKGKKWTKMDRYLDSCRATGIQVSALLGNHDVMSKAKKGEHQFDIRFPNHVRTGFYQIIDSVAIVFLNSNFSKLSPADVEKQQAWLRTTLQMLDKDKTCLFTIVTCHHAPYSNSKIVGSSKKVQQNFVPDFIQSKKARLFITGHSHNYEHFVSEGKDFLVIGGGGGLGQPLSTSKERLDDISGNYKPSFHYVLVTRDKRTMTIASRFLKKDFLGFEKGISFVLTIP